MKKINIFITFTLGLLLISCATYQPQYASNYQNNTSTSNDKEVERTFYLIGNAGYIGETEKNLELKSFQNYIADKNTKDANLLFLGNSFYPKGMPEDDEPALNKAKEVILAAREKVVSEITKKKMKLDEDLTSEIQNVEKEIIELKLSSPKKINSIASNITNEVIKRLIGTDVNESSVSALVEEELKKLSRSTNGI